MPFQGSRQSATQTSWQPKLAVKPTNYNSSLIAVIIAIIGNGSLQNTVNQMDRDFRKGVRNAVTNL